MLTHDPAYFDFIHTLLPTKLPLRAFYREDARLVTGAVAPTNALAFLGKYAWKDLPGVLANIPRVVSRIRNAHRDYPPIRLA